MVLFGDLEHRCSIGAISYTIPPLYVDSKLICFASGHVLQTIDSTTGTVGPLSLALKNPITCFTLCQKENVLAVAEKGSCDVALYALNNFKPFVQTRLLQGLADSATISACFTPDSLKLVTLCGYPNFTVAIWEWRKGIISCYAYNSTPAKLVSINPMNPRQICVSGYGKTKFWWIKEGYKRSSLKCTSKPETFVNLFNQRIDKNAEEKVFNYVKVMNKVMDIPHEWTNKNKLLLAGKQDEIYLVDPLTNETRVAYSGSAIHSQSINALSFTKDTVIIARKNGKIDLIAFQDDIEENQEEETENFEIVTLTVSKDEIKALLFSPDHRNLLVIDNGGSLFNVDCRSKKSFPISMTTAAYISIQYFPSFKKVAGITESGDLTFWSLEEKQIESSFKINVHDSISTFSTHPLGPLLALGSSDGYFRIFSYHDDPQIAKLLFKKKLFNSSIKAVCWDLQGRRAAVASANEALIAIVELHNNINLVGYVKSKDVASQIQFQSFEDEKGEDVSHLFCLSANGKTKLSYISKYSFTQKPIHFIPSISNYLIPKEYVTTVSYCLELPVNSIMPVVSQLTNGKESFFALTNDRHLRLYNFPVKKGYDERIDLVNIPANSFLNEYSTHEKSNAVFAGSFNREWLITMGDDGSFVFRSLLEVENSLITVAHSSFLNGVKCLAFPRDIKTLVSVGYDGIMRFYDWKFTPNGKRASITFTEECNQWYAAHDEISRSLKNMIMETSSVTDDKEPKSVIEQYTEQPTQESIVLAPVENTAFKQSLIERIAEVRQKITEAIKINEKVPAIEKLELDVFIIDEDEKKRLMQKGKELVEGYRHAVELENDKNRVLFKRLKHMQEINLQAECWDQLEVNGKAVKSFNISPSTGKKIQINNMPLLKRTKEDQLKEEKLIIFRRSQVVFKAFVDKRHSKTEDDLELEIHSKDKTISFESIPEYSLLYHPFQLVSREKKRVQMALLRHMIRDIKVKFNTQFEDICQAKRDEITKIEEKIERVKEILDELKMQEEFFKPNLDDDEVPERAITIHESEIKAEKYITQEARKKMEEQKAQEEMRKKSEKEDNWRERALNLMMNGKLEDQTEQKERQVLVKPEWMNDKTKTDWTEEEKKAIKEFEKKLAIQREEQEKYRKALETELRKIQASITEICAAFDEKLRLFLLERLNTDQLLSQLELMLCKLQKSLVFSETDDIKENALIDRLNDLKQEKLACAAEIPEIKKDLEHCREDYETAVKRDKELEKVFKKEFHDFEFHFDHLWRLFKRRDKQAKAEADSKTDMTDESMNPFDTGDLYSGLAEVTASPLNKEVDMPEELDIEVWNKVVEFREKKISLEQEVRNTNRKFNEMQNLVSIVVHDSERIKSEMDAVTAEYNAFLEYKFMSMYNVEALFQLKQGQVEVPQAAVLTDYADAALINRNVVEKLNERILHLGNQKVEALVEMKNYRKGIHALDWENKVLDFQADNLINRTRDIQLLRVTKQMQDFIRSGDESKQTSELVTLEKQIEYNQQAHHHKKDEKRKVITRLKKKIQEKKKENSELEEKASKLESSVLERDKIHKIQVAQLAMENRPEKVFNYVHQHSQLLEKIRAQEEDLQILKQELQKLNMKTFPRVTDGDEDDFSGQSTLLKTNAWTLHVRQPRKKVEILDPSVK